MICAQLVRAHSLILAGSLFSIRGETSGAKFWHGAACEFPLRLQSLPKLSTAAEQSTSRRRCHRTCSSRGISSASTPTATILSWRRRRDSLGADGAYLLPTGAAAS